MKREKILDFSLEEIDEAVKWISSFSDIEREGTTRLVYSNSWVNVQKELKKKYEEIGLITNFDSVGNLIGKKLGTNGNNETIMTGSHIDTVIGGGKLDGQLGVISAYLVLKKLIEKYGNPKKNIEIVSMAEEEGARFPYMFWGSKNILGLAKKEEVENLVDKEGINFVTAMKNAGFDFPIENIKRDDIKAFIELHIEQGNYLNHNNITIGVVEGIVAQKRHNIVLVGEANHAGTTLMGFRKDPVYCMSKIIQESIEMAKEEGDPLVLTFGKITVEPNIVNVVPGKVELTMDTRHSNKKFLEDFVNRVFKNINKITKDMGIGFSSEEWLDEDPTYMDNELVENIENICIDNGYKYTKMFSGAAHDSQIFAREVPTSMIFVPSIDGISHNPKEDTKLEDLKAGVEVLGELIYKLAY